jgi:hypothetical protein
MLFLIAADGDEVNPDVAIAQLEALIAEIREGSDSDLVALFEAIEGLRTKIDARYAGHLMELKELLTS